MRRIRLVSVFAAALALTAARAEAVSVRDVIELSKAGVSDAVLLALIDVERPVFTIDTATVKQLKDAGLSDTVIVAMIRSGRSPRAEQSIGQSAPPSAPDALPPAPDLPPAFAAAVPGQAELPSGPTVPEPQTVGERPSVAGAPTGVVSPTAVSIAVVPVYVPVAVPVPASHSGHRATTQQIIQSPQVGMVKADVPIPPNCVKAEPVYWGFGGTLRPGSWQPEPTVVCR